ncbi:CAP domain-containing protein [Streptomyces sp. NBC_00247]|uniref:CAP domain-containing protein n=1 Tax=Streptomyces sp. NBC_00247 TaxID=2975689 RepID=UPI002E290723|nr:CAP domain-containing protein [Streptomyces sp. NBC_00247]
MGRHRRSAAAGPAADETAPAPSGGRHGGARRTKRRVPLPVRAGLLGISAAVAVGAVAAASGMLPGGETYGLSDSSHADRADSAGAPDLLTQGTASADATDRAASPTPASRGSERPGAPSEPASATPSASPTEKTASPTPSATPSVTKTTAAPAPAKSTAAAAAPAPTSAAPKTEAPATSAVASARTAVLDLVNQERSKAGCSPVTLSSSLTSLAQSFSQDMAARDFFDHTDPDGDTPWDRAAAAGITNLGGENIARGQADAQAVMDSWMNSEGHRANILNCDYTTLGVGVHIADGGPWWTQDFGF